MDQTKTVWAEVIGSFIRVAMTFFGSRLLAKQIISQELYDRLLTDGTAQLLGYALIGVALIWSLRNKIWAFIKARIAILSPAKTTEAQVDSAVSDMPLTEKLSVALTSADVPHSAIPVALPQHQ